MVEMNTFTGRGTISVGGIPEHGRRGIFELPAEGGGRVRAKLRASLLDPYPTIEVDGVKHRTGPESPIILRLLGLLPFGLVFVGGLIGGLIGGVGVCVNLAVARGKQSMAVKALLMTLVLMGAALAYLVAAGVVAAAVTDQGV
jgi:hypothetical protein